MLDSPARANTMLTALREELIPRGGGVFIVRTSKRLERRRAMIRVTLPRPNPTARSTRSPGG